MGQFYLKSFVKRFVVYPVLVGLVSYYLFGFIQESYLGELFYELGPFASLEKSLGFTIPLFDVKFLYFYAVGFTYGTMSMFLPLHKLGLGMVGLILMYVKLFLSMFAFAPFAFVVAPVELTVVLIYLLIKMKKHVKVKKEDMKPNLATLKELKEWANATT